MSLFGLEPPAPAVPRTKEEVKATIKEAEKQKKAKEKEIKASAGAKSKAVKAEQQARRKLEKVQKKGHPEHHEDHQAALSQLQAAVDAAVEAQAKMLAAEVPPSWRWRSMRTRSVSSRSTTSSLGVPSRRPSVCMPPSSRRRRRRRIPARVRARARAGRVVPMGAGSTWARRSFGGCLL